MEGKMGPIEIGAAGMAVLFGLAVMAKLVQAVDRVVEAIGDASLIGGAREDPAAPATIDQLFGKRVPS
jgi:hypothetical protein